MEVLEGKMQGVCILEPLAFLDFLLEGAASILGDAGSFLKRSYHPEMQELLQPSFG